MSLSADRTGFASSAATKRAHRREEVATQLETATRELISKGESFTELSVERLASTAGISRSTFYLYFPDKADLLRALTEPIVKEWLTAASTWWEIDQPITRERLTAILAPITAIYFRNAVLAGSLIDMTYRDHALREHVTGLMDQAISQLAQHITRGQQQGWMGRQLPATETASWLMWMIERAHRQLLSVDGPQLQRIIDSFVDVVWNVLYAYPVN